MTKIKTHPLKEHLKLTPKQSWNKCQLGDGRSTTSKPKSFTRVVTLTSQMIHLSCHAPKPSSRKTCVAWLLMGFLRETSHARCLSMLTRCSISWAIGSGARWETQISYQKQCGKRCSLSLQATKRPSLTSYKNPTSQTIIKRKKVWPRSITGWGKSPITRPLKCAPISTNCYVTSSVSTSRWSKEAPWWKS